MCNTSLPLLEVAKFSNRLIKLTGTSQVQRPGAPFVVETLGLIYEKVSIQAFSKKATPKSTRVLLWRFQMAITYCMRIAI